MKNLYTLIIGLLGSSFLLAQNTLNIPQAISNTQIDLVLQQGETEILAGVVSPTMGANGSLLGPTLILQKGSDVQISVENLLDEITTVHWHGLHVSPENDGGPHSIIEPGQTWNPSFTVLDKAGTYWYHPHLHMHTNEHVTKGIAGMILVRDDEESSLDIPLNYGVDEFPVIIQTKDIDAQGEILVGTHGDDVVMVNGTVEATLDVPAQVVRLRLLNGSSQRFLNLGFTDDMPFQIIGTDGGLLAAPVELTRYRLAPGQRADVLVNLSGQENENFELLSYASELPNAIYGANQPGMGAGQTGSLSGYTSNPLNGSDFTVLSFHVTEPTENPITIIPQALAQFEVLQEQDATVTRNVTFSTSVMMNLEGPFLINGASFDMEVINYEIPLDNIEIWSLTNQTPTAHPFHIHDVQFHIIDINGAAPPAEMQGYHDVITVPGGMGNVRFIAQFSDFASAEVPYMFHCHMLPHEDGGMMGQFLVVDPDTDVDEKNPARTWRLYPNPSQGQFFLQSDECQNLRIYASNGQLLQTYTSICSGVQSMTFEPGVYVVIADDGSSERIIIY